MKKNIVASIILAAVTLGTINATKVLPTGASKDVVSYKEGGKQVYVVKKAKVAKKPSARPVILTEAEKTRLAERLRAAAAERRAAELKAGREAELRAKLQAENVSQIMEEMKAKIQQAAAAKTPEERSKIREFAEAAKSRIGEFGGDVQRKFVDAYETLKRKINA